MTELLPCPFCGETRIYLNKPGFGYKRGSINCPACLAVMPGEVNEAELVDCWNGRAVQGMAIPSGWKLVPIELTDAMRWAGGSALHDEGEDTEGIWRAILAETPEVMHGPSESTQEAGCCVHKTSLDETCPECLKWYRAKGL